MATDNETVEDIISRVRAQWQGCESVSLAELDGADLLNIIDRIEAAWRREMKYQAVHNCELRAKSGLCGLRDEIKAHGREVAELRECLKEAEDALVVCMAGMCGECHRQHPGETCVNGCYEMSMAKNALAAIREEK